jgi:hypothetical protein
MANGGRVTPPEQGVYPTVERPLPQAVRLYRDRWLGEAEEPMRPSATLAPVGRAPRPVAHPRAVSARLLEHWRPDDPRLSRYLPDHAEVLYRYLQDHAGERFTVDELHARRGGAREYLEAALDLLASAGLVEVFELWAPDLVEQYSVDEPRLLEVPHGPPSPPAPTRRRRKS